MYDDASEYRCQICGRITNSPDHWFIIQCGDCALTVLKWNSEAANAPGARHFCGEAHAQVYISRWFESICSPPKADFTRTCVCDVITWNSLNPSFDESGSSVTRFGAQDRNRHPSKGL